MEISLILRSKICTEEQRENESVEKGLQRPNQDRFPHVLLQARRMIWNLAAFNNGLSKDYAYEPSIKICSIHKLCSHSRKESGVGKTLDSVDPMARNILIHQIS